MTNIYKITNLINGNLYIGVTTKTIEERMNQHKNESTKERSKNRPLYRAFNKYGSENFTIELIEQVENEQIGFEKEKYWIKEFDSYKNGYNATLGGDVTPYIDYDLVVKEYRELKNMKEVAKKLNISSDSVSNILNSRNEPILTSSERNKAKGYSVEQYDLKDNYIQTFNSISDAIKYLGKKVNDEGHLRQVCNGKRKTAYGFKWKYVNK